VNKFVNNIQPVSY